MAAIDAWKNREWHEDQDGPKPSYWTRAQGVDESYDDWQERIHGERPKYDENGNEIMPDWMINNMTPFKRSKSEPLTHRNRAGYVYLLEVPNQPGLYKIGRASNPENRLRTFAVKLPFPVFYAHLIKSTDCYKLERQLHELFASQRLEGEFFHLTAADVMVIKSLQGD